MVICFLGRMMVNISLTFNLIIVGQTIHESSEFLGHVPPQRMFLFGAKLKSQICCWWEHLPPGKTQLLGFAHAAVRFQPTVTCFLFGECSLACLFGLLKTPIACLGAQQHFEKCACYIIYSDSSTISFLTSSLPCCWMLEV